MLEAIKALRSGKKIEYFYPWFWAMAKKRFCMFLRMKAQHTVELDTVADALMSYDDVETALISDHEISELNYSISRLSHLHREIIILFYLKEMKIAEIAALLDIPEGTVKRRLYDAKNNRRNLPMKVNRKKENNSANIQCKKGHDKKRGER